MDGGVIGNDDDQDHAVRHFYTWRSVDRDVLRRTAVKPDKSSRRAHARTAVI